MVGTNASIRIDHHDPEINAVFVNFITDFVSFVALFGLLPIMSFFPNLSILFPAFLKINFCF